MADASEWLRVGIEAEEATEWIGAGFGPVEALLWKDAGAEPTTARVLSDCGVGPGDIGDVGSTGPASQRGLKERAVDDGAQQEIPKKPIKNPVGDQSASRRRELANTPAARKHRENKRLGLSYFCEHNTLRETCVACDPGLDGYVYMSEGGAVVHTTPACEHLAGGQEKVRLRGGDVGGIWAYQEGGAPTDKRCRGCAAD